VTVLRVVHGDPTPEEIAALVTVLATRSAAAAGTPPPSLPVAGWADRASRLRRPVAAGPGAWRASALHR
jgi:hypothetical protein